MPSGQPLTIQQKDAIVSLSAEGANGYQIAAQLGISSSSIYRTLRKARRNKKRPTKLDICVLDDPTGLFAPMSEFCMLDVAYGVKMETWPDGIIFKIGNRVAIFQDNTLTRDDGYWLQTRDGGYKWLI